MSPSAYVDVENCGLVKKSGEVAIHKISSADTENHGLVMVEEAAIHREVNINLGTNTVTRGPMKMFAGQTSIDSKRVSLKQATGPTLSAVQQSTRCNETDEGSADSSQVELQSQIGQLSGELEAEELNQIYSRVFYRR